MKGRAVLLGAIVLLASCSLTGPDPENFSAWQDRHREDVESLRQYLAEQGVSDVLPMDELLRSASDWQPCDEEPFGLPPRNQWPQVVSVLSLLQFLESTGVVGDIKVYSGYRNPALNACAGGAPASAHARSFALDFKAVGAVDAAANLCEFWRDYGKQWNMGFSVYPSGRIHIDTAGYRTWGYDYTGRSAACRAG